MRRFVVILVASTLVAGPVHARPTADSPWKSRRYCGLLVEVNRSTFEWVVVLDPSTVRSTPGVITGRATSRKAAWQWGRAFARWVGGCS